MASIIDRIEVRKDVRKIQIANPTQVANLNASVEDTSRPAGAMPEYVRVSGLFARRSIRGCYHRRIAALVPLAGRLLRTSENSRYAKFAPFRGGISHTRGLVLLSGLLRFEVLWLSPSSPALAAFFYSRVWMIHRRQPGSECFDGVASPVDDICSIVILRACSTRPQQETWEYYT